MCGPHHCPGRDASAPRPDILCRPLQSRQDSSILEQGCTAFSPGSANRSDKFTRHPGWTSSPLRSCLSFRYRQATLAHWLGGTIQRYGQSSPSIGRARNTLTLSSISALVDATCERLQRERGFVRRAPCGRVVDFGPPSVVSPTGRGDQIDSMAGAGFLWPRLDVHVNSTRPNLSLHLGARKCFRVADFYSAGCRFESCGVGPASGGARPTPGDPKAS
jgi:hypothetical protein